MTSTGQPVTGRPRGKVLATCADQTAELLSEVFAIGPSPGANPTRAAELEGSVQFSSVTQSCPTLCDPMNRSTPGLPVHHHLPEFTQTHVHRGCVPELWDAVPSRGTGISKELDP